ncbi:MAG: hypothetical protein HZB38_04660 [Planctomycetes bacterium]|nr:hypothetical protein [Planctomycetota bacterium]
MSIQRLVLVLVSTMAVMLTVVVLRSERTRLQFKASEYDRETDSVLQELRERELELARLSNPLLIRERLSQMRLEEPEKQAEKKPAKRKP